MTPELLTALQQYDWPGNIRQLRNVMRTMIALRETDVLGVEDLPPEIHQSRQPLPVLSSGEQNTPCLNALKLAERDALLLALEQARWNVSTVARQLGMGRNTLYRKLERLNIDLSDSKKVADPHGRNQALAR